MCMQARMPILPSAAPWHTRHGGAVVLSPVSQINARLFDYGFVMVYTFPNRGPKMKCKCKILATTFNTQACSSDNDS